MAVASTVTNVSYVGNNSTTTEYPVTFPVLDGSHIKVGKRDAGGPFEELPSWTYVVVAKPGGGWAVTTTTAIPSTSTVVLWRAVPVTQPTELPLAGPLPSTSLETAHDRSTMQIQEVRDEIERSVRLDRAAGPQDPLTPIPDALLGFDGNGDWDVVDAARVRELAQLDGDGSNLQATWADSAAQPSVVPVFTGQMGMRRSDNTLWTSRSTTGGDWVPARIPRVIVSTEDELLDAVAANRSIFLSGTINLSSTLDLDVDGVDIKGDGKNSMLVMAHNGATGVAVINVRAKNIKLSGLKITTQHPLTTGIMIEDIGIELANDPTTDFSGLIVEGCEIFNVWCGIRRHSYPTSKKVSNIQVIGNHIHSFNLSGVYIDSNTTHLVIARNLIDGKPAGSTHQSRGNGIRTGFNADYCQILFNTVRNFGRHGIEHFNPQDNPLTVGGNKDGKIIGNSISGPLFDPFDVATISAVSFGISVFGNGVTQILQNSVRGCTIGIEAYSDQVNTGQCIVSGNYVKDTRSQGLSLNALRGGVVSGNIIDGVVDPGGSTACYGMQLIYGCEQLKIHGNKLLNAGTAGIRLNGFRTTITGITQAADATFTTPANLVYAGSPWFVGKRICLSDIAGMTGLNDKYYTITWISGAQFRVGVDTSAMPAYVSGGVVLENWAGLEITDNTFWIPDVVNGSTFQTAMWVYDFQHAVIRDNVAFYKAGISFFTFALSNKGIVFRDDTQTPLVRNTFGGHEPILGTNLYIATFPEA
jgi:nitrous oxidase accessory protein NosD